MKFKSLQIKTIQYWLKNFICPIIIAFAFVFLLFRGSYIGTKTVFDKNNLIVHVNRNENVSDETILTIVEKCDSLMQAKGIDLKAKLHIVFCASRTEYNIKTFFRSRNTLAINRTFRSQIIFAPVDFKAGTVTAIHSSFSNRPIECVLAHELTHTYERQKLGIIKFATCESWKKEGFAEYVSENSSTNIETATNLFVNQKDYDDSLKVERKLWEGPFYYFKSRLKTDYLLKYKHISEDEFWDTKFDESMLENEIRSSITEQKYHLN